VHSKGNRLRKSRLLLIFALLGSIFSRDDLLATCRCISTTRFDSALRNFDARSVSAAGLLIFRPNLDFASIGEDPRDCQDAQL
jgi:hypothetical protein